MKEFIDKLIERLEEYKTKVYVTGITNNAYEFGACNAMDSAIKIINELAEEYNDCILVHAQRLDVGIQCAMCTNSMKSDTGCDGGCLVNKEMYKKVLDVIDMHTQNALFKEGE